MLHRKPAPMLPASCMRTGSTPGHSTSLAAKTPVMRQMPQVRWAPATHVGDLYETLDPDFVLAHFWPLQSEPADARALSFFSLSHYASPFLSNSILPENMWDIFIHGRKKLKLNARQFTSASRKFMDSIRSKSCSFY